MITLSHRTLAQTTTSVPCRKHDRTWDCLAWFSTEKSNQNLQYNDTRSNSVHFRRCGGRSTYYYFGQMPAPKQPVLCLSNAQFVAAHTCSRAMYRRRDCSPQTILKMRTISEDPRDQNSLSGPILGYDAATTAHCSWGGCQTDYFRELPDIWHGGYYSPTNRDTTIYNILSYVHRAQIPR